MNTTSTDGTDGNQNYVDVIINENGGHELNNGLDDTDVEEVEIEEQNVRDLKKTCGRPRIVRSGSMGRCRKTYNSSVRKQHCS